MFAVGSIVVIQLGLFLHYSSGHPADLKQFEQFYWPYLLKLVNALADAGYTPEIFFEGDYTQRLEYLRQLPKGKCIARFDRSDMARAKQVLGWLLEMRT